MIGASLGEGAKASRPGSITSRGRSSKHRCAHNACRTDRTLLPVVATYMRSLIPYSAAKACRQPSRCEREPCIPVHQVQALGVRSSVCASSSAVNIGKQTAAQDASLRRLRTAGCAIALEHSGELVREYVSVGRGVANSGTRCVETVGYTFFGELLSARVHRAVFSALLGFAEARCRLHRPPPMLQRW